MPVSVDIDLEAARAGAGLHEFQNAVARRHPIKLHISGKGGLWSDPIPQRGADPQKLWPPKVAGFYLGVAA